MMARNNIHYKTENETNMYFQTNYILILPKFLPSYDLQLKKSISFLIKILNKTKQFNFLG